MVSLKSKRLALQSVTKSVTHLSIRSACKLLRLNQSTYFYKSTRKRNDDELRAKIMELAESKQQAGRPLITWRLRNRLGFKDNHKRIARIYRELNLQVGKRTKRKLRTQRRFMFIQPQSPMSFGQWILCRTLLQTEESLECLSLA